MFTREILEEENIVVGDRVEMVLINGSRALIIGVIKEIRADRIVVILDSSTVGHAYQYRRAVIMLNQIAAICGLIKNPEDVHIESGKQPAKPPVGVDSKWP
jgi:hypothetical protein